MPNTTAAQSWTASSTTRASSIQSSIPEQGGRSDSPMPRLSNTMSRQNVINRRGEPTRPRLPPHIEVAREPRNDDQVHGSVSRYLVGDPHAAGRRGVTNRGLLLGTQGRATLTSRWRPVELCALLEHGTLEVSKRRPGLHAQVVAQPSPDGVADSKRLGLSAAPIEGEDPLRPEPLAQRIVDDRGARAQT